MNKAKRYIVHKLLRYLFNAVSEDDILKSTPQGLTLGNDLLPREQAFSLVTQANTLKEMSLWKLLLKDCKWTANDMIFNKSKTEDDLIFPKAMLFIVDVLERKVENLSKVKS